ncbi:MAG: lysylphosphatidylglycerol synthase transmembrane domain-containing protein [Longimicrobiales bacterium]|nr:lysylphosphatidylglycerol synthase transmembrane domain-containing protein [Longimicrobiales bacterium]
MDRQTDDPESSGRRWPWLVGWAVLTVIVAWLLRDLAWDEIGAILVGAHPGWVAAAVLANFAILPLVAWQWTLFLPEGNRVPFPRMLRIQFVVAAISNTGPFIAGHAAGVHLVATQGGVGHAAALSAKALDQLSEGISKLVMLGAVVLWVPLPTPLRAATLTLLVAVPALFAGLLLLAHRAHVFERWAAGRSGRTATTIRFMGEVADQMETLRRPGALIGVLGIGLLQKSFEGLAIWCVLQALGLDVPGWGVLLSLSAVSLTTMVSVTPAQLGLFEGSALVAYRLAGLGTEAALGAAVLQHLAYLIPFVGSGWLTLAVVSARPRTVTPPDS